VAFIDPRRSEVDVVQAVGRAIRLAAEKTVGTIVVPVFIDTDEDPEIALDSSAFKPVWDVIQALRSHDDELGEQLDELRRQLGRQGGRPRLPGKIIFDLPARVGSDFARAIDVRLVEQTTTSFELWFGLLEEFVGGHGHALVPQSYTVDGYLLGKWVNTQRRQYFRGTLDADRVQRLQDLPGWTWAWRVDRWDEGFSRLLQYVELNGDARVPRTHTVDGYPLGGWVKTQRKAFTKGLLDADRQRRLEDLPGWTWDPYGDQWEERFSLLLDYVERYGDAVVPTSYMTDDGYQLGKWVAVQRNFHRTGTLEGDRARRLHDLPGWSWSGREAMWEEGFKHLLDYVQRGGDALVPAAHKTDNGYPLGQWVTTQRHFRAMGTLDSDRERRLAELPGWIWNGRDAIWEEGIRRLLVYVERNGDSLVPKSYKDEDGKPLGVWVMRQRKSYAEGSLEADRQRRLEDLPGWTWKARSSS
jgi:hypothetical protein